MNVNYYFLINFICYNFCGNFYGDFYGDFLGDFLGEILIDFLGEILIDFLDEMTEVLELGDNLSSLILSVMEFENFLIDAVFSGSKVL